MHCDRRLFGGLLLVSAVDVSPRRAAVISRPSPMTRAAAWSVRQRTRPTSCVRGRSGRRERAEAKAVADSTVANAAWTMTEFPPMRIQPPIIL